MQSNKEQLYGEGEVFGRYILGKEINKKTIEQYVNSFDVSPMEISDKEQILIDKCVNKSWKLPYFDGALSLKNPNHLLKQKLLRMFAILETRPEYADYFLGKDFPKGYIFKIVLIGVRGVFRALVGLIILPNAN